MANEKRLIDANALTEEISSLGMFLTGVRFGKGVLREYITEYKISILKIVDEAPTVDAAPVAHGRCEYCKDGKSFIGARLILGNDGEWHEINNCPNCGAKMDGGNEDG